MSVAVLGVGTDIVQVARITGVLERQGARFVARILADAEREASGLQGVPEEARAVAKYFAGKEAVAKALGTGFRMGVSWTDIVIDRDAHGAPTVTLQGAALARAASLGGDRMLLSLSDETDYVLAFAVLS